MKHSIAAFALLTQLFLHNTVSGAEGEPSTDQNLQEKQRMMETMMEHEAEEMGHPSHNHEP